jgi:hypothetical protein
VIVKAKFDCINCPTLHKDVHSEPLVAREDFEAVQKLLDAAHKTWTRQKETWETDESPFLGQGVLYCQCGRKIYTKPNRQGNKNKFFYRCSSHNNHNAPCGAPHFRQEEIDAALRKWAMLKLTSRSYLKSIKPVETVLDRELIQRQIADLEKIKASLYAKIGRYKDEAMLDKLIDENQSTLDELQKELKAKPVKRAELDIASMQKRFAAFPTLPLAEQKKAFRETFRRITLDATGSIIAVQLHNCLPDEYLVIVGEHKGVPRWAWEIRSEK